MCKKILREMDDSEKWRKAVDSVKIELQKFEARLKDKDLNRIEKPMN